MTIVGEPCGILHIECHSKTENISGRHSSGLLNAVIIVFLGMIDKRGIESLLNDAGLL